MADRRLRGSRFGSRSPQDERGAELVPRQVVAYLCLHCSREEALQFATDIVAPTQWTCRHCGAQAGRRNGDDVIIPEEESELVGRTPWEMLLERRTIAELEILLADQLSLLRARRGGENPGVDDDVRPQPGR